jgi:hypothetical protein
VKEFTVRLLGFATFDGDYVLFSRDRDIVGRKTRDCQQDLVAVVSQPFDVVRRLVLLAGPLGHFREVKEAGRSQWSSATGESSRKCA